MINNVCYIFVTCDCWHVLYSFGHA